MLCNQGTPEKVCLEGEKELGACTGQLPLDVAVLKDAFCAQIGLQSSSAPWRFACFL